MQPILEISSTRAIAEDRTTERTTRRSATRPRAEQSGDLSTRAAHLVLLFLTALVLAIGGYHPYAEDAGIYIAGVKLALFPRLYPHDSAFVTAYSHLSIFSPSIAALVRLSHLPIDLVLFGVQLATTWLLLYSCWQLARRCFQSPSARWGAVALVAVSLTLPVAGSALFMMDPYVTSRSFSTPLSFLAVCACLDGRPILTVFYLTLVGLLHPLMAIYAVGFLLFLWTVQQQRPGLVFALAAAAVASGVILQLSQRNVVESPAYVSAALTRSYFYLARWEWYEWFGLAAPLLLLFLFSRWQKFRFHKPIVALCGASIAEGLTAILVSLLFSHPGSRSHLIARIQTLRPFITVYFVLFLMLGGLLGDYWLKRIRWRWVLTFATLSSVMFVIQLAAYPASSHLELPGMKPANGWAQAFLWIRSNTPADALFAMDANYITLPGEDSHVFRAMAERSSLADHSKDGGTAAVFPQLAATWMIDHTAEKNLDHISDRQRLKRLLPLGATWIILPVTSRTSFPCPYKNAAVMVCRLV